MRTHCRVVNPDKELFVSDPDPAKITKKRINNQNFTSFCFTEIKVECFLLNPELNQLVSLS